MKLATFFSSHLWWLYLILIAIIIILFVLVLKYNPKYFQPTNMTGGGK